MNRPIIKNENIDFNNLFIFLVDNIKKILKFCLLGIILFSFYFLVVRTPSYSSTISFYTNYTKKTDTSFLSPFIGGLQGQITDLHFSVNNYIKSDKFLEDIVKKEYSINGEKKTLVEHWGNNYNNFITINPISLFQKINKNIMLNKNLSEKEKKTHFAKEYLGSTITHSEERLSNLNAITVRVRRDASLSKEIVENIYGSIIKYSNEVTNIKAFEKRIFIEGRLLEIKKELESSENEMLEFLEENKDFSSPSLLLKKGRIDRDIVLHGQLYLSLSDQLELAKIDEKDNTSSIFLLDSPHISSYKSGITFSKGIIFIFIMFFAIAFSWQAYKNRNQLFI